MPYKINFEKERLIIAILGEVCWGLRVDDFEKKMGVTKEKAIFLLEKLLDKEQKKIYETKLEDSEVQIIHNALSIVEKEIDEWEFFTRIGATLAEIKSMPIFNVNKGA